MEDVNNGLRPSSQLADPTSHPSNSEMPLDVQIGLQFNHMFHVAIASIPNHAVAEDIASTAIFKAIKSQQSFDREPTRQNVLAWLLRITHNTIVDYVRSSNRISEVSLDVLQDEYDFDVADTEDGDGSVCNVAPDEQRVALDALLNTASLPNNQQAMLRRRYLSGANNPVPYRQIGEEFGVSESAARLNVWRAEQRLRHLAGQLYPDGSLSNSPSSVPSPELEP